MSVSLMPIIYHTMFIPCIKPFTIFFSCPCSHLMSTIMITIRFFTSLKNVTCSDMFYLDQTSMSASRWSVDSSPQLYCHCFPCHCCCHWSSGLCHHTHSCLSQQTKMVSAACYTIKLHLELCVFVSQFDLATRQC